MIHSDSADHRGSGSLQNEATDTEKYIATALFKQ